MHTTLWTVTRPIISSNNNNNNIIIIIIIIIKRFWRLFLKATFDIWIVGSITTHKTRVRSFVLTRRRVTVASAVFHREVNEGDVDSLIWREADGERAVSARWHSMAMVVHGIRRRWCRFSLHSLPPDGARYNSIFWWNQNSWPSGLLDIDLAVTEADVILTAGGDARNIDCSPLIGITYSNVYLFINLINSLRTKCEYSTKYH